MKKKYEKKLPTNIYNSQQPPWVTAKTKQDAFIAGRVEGYNSGYKFAKEELNEKVQLHSQREQAIKIMDSVGQTIDALNRLVNP